MARFFTLLIFVFFSLHQATAQVGIGVDVPHPSAKLEISATDQGFLPPRMNKTQRNAITDPADGLVIYNSSALSQCLQFYKKIGAEGAWTDICCYEKVESLSDNPSGIFFNDVSKLFQDDLYTTPVTGDGDPIKSIGPFDFSAFNTNGGSGYPSNTYFTFVDQGETNANSTSPVIEYKESSDNINDYTSTGLIGKSNFINTSNFVAIDHFLMALPTTNIYAGSFTISLIARYASTPLQNANGFFCVGASAGSFQIDNHNGNFSIRLTTASGSSTIRTNVPLDTEFHSFQIVKDVSVAQGNSGRLKIFIDGEQVNTGAGEDAHELNIFGNVRLLSNRSNNRRVDGEIAYFGLEAKANSAAEVQSFSSVANCLFEEY